MTTNDADRPDEAVGNHALDDVLSAIRTLLRSDHPLPERPRLRVVGGNAGRPTAADQTTRLPVKS